MVEADLRKHVDAWIQPGMLEELLWRRVRVEHAFAVLVRLSRPVDDVPIIVELIIAILALLIATLRLAFEIYKWVKR